MALPESELTPDNCVFMMIDHQVGLLSFLTAIDPTLLKNNILGHAKSAKAFDIPVIMARLAAAGGVVTTWVAVLAKNTRHNGRHIGALLSEHMGQYYAAMNGFLGSATHADEVAKNVGLTGHPPIPMAGYS